MTPQRLKTYQQRAQDWLELNIIPTLVIKHFVKERIRDERATATRS